MGSQMVTIATFGTAMEAHVAKTSLDSEGIASFVADEHTVAMNWLYSNAIGGVKLQVSPEDAQRARAHLSRINSDAEIRERTREASEVICMNCGSSEVFYQKKPRAVTIFSFFLFAIPLFFSKRIWKCENCQTEWKV